MKTITRTALVALFSFAGAVGTARADSTSDSWEDQAVRTAQRERRVCVSHAAPACWARPAAVACIASAVERCERAFGDQRAAQARR